MKVKDLDLIKKPFGQRMLLMLLGVFIMGWCVAILNMTNFGVDPFSAFNYGLCELIGLSFGTTEVIVNAILLLTVIFFDVSKLGFGTLGNMILVGYTADFATFIMKKFGITAIDGMFTRIIVMLIVLIVFIFAVALYVNAGLGGAPYDALPYIIYDKVCKLLGRQVKFKIVRIAFDGAFTVIAFLLNGSVGIITVLIVVGLGPAIEYVSKLVKKNLKL